MDSKRVQQMSVITCAVGYWNMRIKCLKCSSRFDDTVILYNVKLSFVGGDDFLSGVVFKIFH